MLTASNWAYYLGDFSKCSLSASELTIWGISKMPTVSKWVDNLGDFSKCSLSANGLTIGGGGGFSSWSLPPSRLITLGISQK